VLEQREAVGHAVRAVYMYSGMADAAALLGDAAFAGAIEAIWRDVAETKAYLTGGLGARHKGEAFGEAFELPNATAYAETCAAVGAAMWNHRLFLLTGEAKYVDFLEQVLYNRLLAGVSIAGDEYFYVSQLESDGKFPFNHGSACRRPWFDVSCCPTNLCRFFPSLPGYFYAVRGKSVYVNLYASGSAAVSVDGVRMELVQGTGYPWDGVVALRVSPERPVRAELLLRGPGWTEGRIMGGGLYRHATPPGEEPTLRVNGSPYPLRTRSGYASVEREWRDGDVVRLALPMPPRKVICDPRVDDNRGKAAIMRGPLVYCVEAADSSLPLEKIVLGPESELLQTPTPASPAAESRSGDGTSGRSRTTPGATGGRPRCGCGSQTAAPGSDQGTGIAEKRPSFVKSSPCGFAASGLSCRQEESMILCCGEALIDMVPSGDAYRPCPGGSPYNSAVAVGRLGAPVAFVGRLSRDFFGQTLVERLAANGVRTDLIARSDQTTTLAFVKLADGEEPQYAFYTEGSADRSLSPRDLPERLPPEASCILFGSISMTMEPIASTIEALVKREAQNLVVSLDPNIRPVMIKDKESYVRRLEGWMASSTIVKISGADMESSTRS
jgi:hypothetical protein